MDISKPGVISIATTIWKLAPDFQMGRIPLRAEFASAAGSPKWTINPKPLLMFCCSLSPSSPSPPFRATIKMPCYSRPNSEITRDFRRLSIAPSAAAAAAQNQQQPRGNRRRLQISARGQFYEMPPLLKPLRRREGGRRGPHASELAVRRLNATMVQKPAWFSRLRKRFARTAAAKR